ncbi:hypothetical protein [Stieleria mannarensis]|uniref:hypothetical protein n=1 Tax=Stieleria mannarensis TaxID=2755585 RepID=UPI001601ADE1|nr:hypothetical protein [Rhodopirellula sp. JC639]
MIRSMVMICMCHLTIVSTMWAQEPTQEYETLKQFYRHQAKRVRFRLDDDGLQRLKLEDPVFTWTGLDYQKYRDTLAPNSGDVYVWTYQGRAVVAGGVLSQPTPSGREVYQEFQALIETPPRPIRSPMKWGQMWSPVGVKLRSLPTAPTPPPGDDDLSRRRRDLQMRGIAKQFTAETRSVQTGQVDALRLIPKAVFRLNATELRKADSAVIDGSLFIFTNQLGTDPELTLLIECHETDEGLVWKYAPGSLAFQEIWLKHNGRQVWHLPNYLDHPGEGNFNSSRLYDSVSIKDIESMIQQ